MPGPQNPDKRWQISYYAFADDTSSMRLSRQSEMLEIGLSTCVCR